MKTEHVLPDDGKRTQQRRTEVTAMAINKVIVIGNLGANPVTTRITLLVPYRRRGVSAQVSPEAFFLGATLRTNHFPVP